jgi:hypothetical protein
VDEDPIGREEVPGVLIVRLRDDLDFGKQILKLRQDAKHVNC